MRIGFKISSKTLENHSKRRARKFTPVRCTKQLWPPGFIATPAPVLFWFRYAHSNHAEKVPFSLSSYPSMAQSSWIKGLDWRAAQTYWRNEYNLSVFNSKFMENLWAKWEILMRRNVILIPGLAFFECWQNWRLDSIFLFMCYTE